MKSEKVLLVWSERVVESDPPDCAVAMGGDDRAARMLSPVAPCSSDTLLLPGLVRLATDVGSMSSEDRKEVLSSSGFVLVMVRKESRRSFCAALGVPLRSRIFWKLEKEASPMTSV